MTASATTKVPHLKGGFIVGHLQTTDTWGQALFAINAIWL